MCLISIRSLKLPTGLGLCHAGLTSCPELWRPLQAAASPRMLQWGDDRRSVAASVAVPVFCRFAPNRQQLMSRVNAGILKNGGPEEMRNYLP